MRAGVDAATGRVARGWEHCVQSLDTILSTRIGTRLMRRGFGAAVGEMQDRLMTPARLMQVYSDVADAIQRHEPGFRLTGIRATVANAAGLLAIEIEGLFYPRGHLGDFSVLEERAAVLGGAA